ncbi:uncharacterized protein LOC134528323 [Bacillus rossius redtenbacheri]|uniref:uncharacterized protein LOC134528323 n=1 Tax=Bacillus rossius redtenbacheri TaxID=93214 RepID=UPI002FDDAF9D
MKVLAVVLALAAAAAAELPANYGSPDAQVEAAPYPPSGWRPSGRQFQLPARQSSNYLPPPQYGPPQYGPPEEETTEQPSTTELPTTTEVSTEQDGSDELADGNSAAGRRQRLQQREREQLDSGLYYVLLPDGRLQRVAYTAGRDAALSQQLSAQAPQQLSNGYYAQIQYHDVEPIRAPIYQYSAPLVRILK